MCKLWKLERSLDIPGKETMSEVGEELGWGGVEEKVLQG